MTMVGTCTASFEFGQGQTFGWPLGVTSRDAGNANLPSSLRSPPSYVWFITSLKMSFILMLVFFFMLSSITSLNATLFFYLRGASSIYTLHQYGHQHNDERHSKHTPWEWTCKHVPNILICFCVDIGADPSFRTFFIQTLHQLMKVRQPLIFKAFKT